MQFLPLLGRHLKDDKVIEIIEHLEAEVVYDFDRLHEGQPDMYWATAKQAGVLLRFDAAQTLDTVFLYVTPCDGFAAVSPTDCDVPLFATMIQAEACGSAQGLQVSQGQADFLGVISVWIRLSFQRVFGPL